MFLVVYIDGFKLAGPKALMKECWASIRRDIWTHDFFPVGKYVGCDHKASQRLDPKSGAKLRVMEYDMSDFMRSCVDRYAELAGIDRSSLREVCTPFLAEPREPSPARDPMESGDDLNSLAIGPDGGIDAARGRLRTTHRHMRLNEGLVRGSCGSIRSVESSEWSCHRNHEMDSAVRHATPSLD